MGTADRGEAEIPDNMSAVKVLADDAQFQAELSSAGSKLVVVDFTASWCGPCKRIAPFYDELSAKYSKAVFLKVDVDQCQETAAGQGVTAMPTVTSRSSSRSPSTRQSSATVSR